MYLLSIINTGDSHQNLGNFEKSLANYNLAKYILIANFENIGHFDDH